jgi:NADP-dependent alcohol dehydrogenase
VVCPAVLRHQRQHKSLKLLQYARRVWGIEEPDDEQAIDAAIARTETFFQEVGVPTRLSDYGLTPSGCQAVAERFRRRGVKLGEHNAIGGDEIKEILALCA